MNELIIKRIKKVDGTDGYVCYLETLELFGLSRKQERLLATSKQVVLKLLERLVY